MSQVEVDKVIPQSGTTLTIGDSGDTVTIPSGATLAIAGSVTGFTSAGIDDNATSVAITINSSEQVGIGTTSPDHLLHISASSSNAQLKLQRTGSATATYNISASSDGLAFSNQVTGSEVMRITSTGLGIGTSSPTSLLSLEANSPDIMFTDTSGGTDSKKWRVFGLDSDFRIGCRNDANSSGQTAYEIIRSSATIDSHRFSTGGSERMRITSAGQLLVGTTDAPSSSDTPLKIHVPITSSGRNALEISQDTTGTDKPGAALGLIVDNSGSSTNAAQLSFSTASGGSLSERMRINSSGNVGIGTTSPQSKLHVVGSSTTSQIIIENTDTGTAAAPDLFLYRNSSSPADGDSLGNIEFRGKNDNTEDTRYVINNAKIIDASDGTEDGQIEWQLLNAGSFQKILTMNPTEVVINEDSKDTDFRVESDGNTNGLFFEGSSGLFGVGTNDGSISVVGFKVFGTDDSTNKSGVNIVTAGGNTPCSLNRSTGDGTLMSFRSQTTQEGSISVSGTTVTYSGFTGTHWSRFTDNSTPTILRGTVLETLDEMCDWYNLEFDVTQNEQTWKEKIPHVLADGQSDGDVITYNHEGTDVQATIVKEGDVKHMMSKVSDTTDAKNVYGLFVAYDLDGEGYNDFYVASVGSYVVRIKQGETIAKGDLLQSNGDGTAKVQTDDNVKSSSFAKVLSTTIIETYEDGSYLVPCSLMC
jgi:hypothetical protein